VPTGLHGQYALGVMPIAQSSKTPARQAILVGLGATMGLLSILFLVTQADRLTGQGSTNLDLEVADGLFHPGNIERLSADIEANGPLFFSDLSGGDRDILLQHLGPSPKEGWFAIGARADDATRDCFVEWTPSSDAFVDNCDATHYPADGAGLPSYLLQIDAAGDLAIDLDAEQSNVTPTTTLTDD